MKINQLKAGAILSYISIGLGTIISILYTPIMLRLLGQSEYGLYSLVSSVIAYLGLLSLGFGSSYVRFYSRYKVKNQEENIAELNGLFLIIFSIIGIISLIFGSLLYINIGQILGDKLTITEIDKAKYLILIMVFNISLSFPLSIFNSYITANERFLFQNLVQILRTVVNPFVMLPILIMGYGSIGMVMVTFIVNISIGILNIDYCKKKLKMKFLLKNLNYKLLKEISEFSFYIFLIMVVNQVNWNVDKFLLGRFNGIISVAIYGLAAQVSTYYVQIACIIATVFVPRINRMIASSSNNELITEIFIKIGRLQFILLSLIFTGFIFFGRPFILFWAGKSYEKSYIIIIILILTTTIPLIQHIGMQIYRAKNLHKFPAFCYIVIAIINVIISIPLIKLYGAVGASIGTAISYVIGNGIIINIYYFKIVKINVILFWKNILEFFPGIAIISILGVLINKYFDLYNIYNFFILGVIYVIVFVFLMWKFGMNSYEKQLFKGLINKILKIY